MDPPVSTSLSLSQSLSLSSTSRHPPPAGSPHTYFGCSSLPRSPAVRAMASEANVVEDSKLRADLALEMED